MMKLHEVARYLNVSEDTIRRMCYRKAIPFRKVGKLYRFDQREVDQARKGGQRVGEEAATGGVVLGRQQAPRDRDGGQLCNERRLIRRPRAIQLTNWRPPVR
jgi:excisionase family DNA binding protein